MTTNRILIAEDEAIVAEGLRLTLVELGYDVPAVVHDGEELVAKIAELRPDLILMDISLAGNIHGINTAEKIHARSDIPIICLTGHEDDDTFHRERKTDPFAYLLKPFDPIRIDNAIEQTLCKHRLEVQLKKSESWYRTIFEASGNAMMIVEENDTISMVNVEFERLSGYAKEEVENRKSWTEFLMGNELEEQRCLHGDDAQSIPPHYETFFFCRDKNARIVYANVKMIPGTRRCIVSMSDMSALNEADKEINKLNNVLVKVNYNLKREIAERKNVEKQLLHQANHDSLTGLPNRELLIDRLKQAFAFADRHDLLFALVLLDLDNFKEINDTAGHLVGDILLKEVAIRLQQCMRQCDTVARLGGDEFVVIANEMKDFRDIDKFAEKVLGLFRQPYDILGQSKYMTTSIGVAVYPLHGTSTEALLKMADMAMYQAKREGKNAFRFFSDKMSLKGDEQTARKETLRAALEKEEFLPHYQPRVDTQSGKITGMEALIRWQPLGSPLLFPAEFFHLLEDSGLVVPVGEWLLEKVCRQNKSWQDAGIPPLCVAVNISPRQFRQENFPHKVAEVLSACGLDPRYLEIDLTEKAIMEDVDESIKKLKKLKEIGIKISIGNFGTGFSSLSCLNRLPIDELKLDRSIINGITSSTNDATVVSASIAMGHSLGKMLVAEGVESEGQYEFLAQQRCEEMQGYYFSRPLPSEDFEMLIRREQPLGASYH